MPTAALNALALRLLRPMAQGLSRAGAALGASLDRLQRGSPRPWPHRTASEDALEAMRSTRDVIAQRFVAAGGSPSLDHQAVQALAAHALVRPDAKSLAQYLYECIGFEALQGLVSMPGDAGAKRASRASLESFLQAALECSRGDAPGFDAARLEFLIDEWVVDGLLPGHDKSNSLADTMRLLSRAIDETSESQEQARLTRLGLALSTCAPIVMWRFIDGLPEGERRSLGWPSPGRRGG